MRSFYFNQYKFVFFFKPCFSLAMSKQFKAEIIWKDPDELIPYQNNSKNHPEEQIEQLAGIIAKYGFDQPIVIGHDNVIIKGHGRREAALKLTLKLVPCIVQTLDEYEAMAARIADNKLSETSYDTDKLKFDIGTLVRHEIDPTKFGFSAEELKVLTDGWNTNHETVSGTESNTDGITAIIKISCPQELKSQVKEMLEEAIQNATVENPYFDNVKIES